MMKKSIVKMMSDASTAAATEKQVAPEDGASRKVTTPVVNSMGRALSQLREDSIVLLDPSKIDSSPFSDRFETDDEAKEALEELKSSIHIEGQKLPILVRPHPEEAGRYQLAYGHRRLAAVKSLMEEASKPESVKVKAYVRKLSDEELIKEQSLENGVRENLTFVEMAVWAAQLRQAGLKQREMEPVLGQVQTVISNMLKVADTISTDVLHAIGRAKNVGRPAWMKFARAFSDPNAEERIRDVIASDRFREASAPERMAIATEAARGRGRSRTTNPGYLPLRKLAADGVLVASVRKSGGATVFSVPRAETDFADWLSDELPELYRKFMTGQDSDNRTR
ncbi:MAG: plasmid partitioning protein RepB [Lentilitoribacter sp.]